MSKYLFIIRSSCRQRKHVETIFLHIYIILIYTDILCFNLLNTKRNMFYIRKHSLPRCKYFIKTNQLMTYTAKAAVCSEIRTKHSTESEHHIEFLNVQPGDT
jgi:hypothetical protein